MPVKKKKYFKPKKKDYKKKYKINKGRLMTQKIDSLVEARMQQIAQKEDSKLNPSLCLRRYCWVDYNPFTNSFRSLPLPAVNSFNYDGQFINLTELIRKEDYSTAANLPVVDIPSTQENEAALAAADGVNVITSRHIADGRRTSDKIIITGYSIKCRMFANYIETNPTDVNAYDNIQLHIGLVKARRNWINDLGNEEEIEWEADQLLKIRPWGYNSTLDRESEIELRGRIVTTLFRAKENLKSTKDTQKKIYFKSYKGTFKKPVKINYFPLDVQGQGRNNYDVFLVIRSSVASSGSANDIQAQPYCQTCVKLYYKNVK